MPGSQLKEKMFKWLGQVQKNKENRETHTKSWGELFQGFYTQKIERWFLSVSGAHDSVSINIHSFFVVDQDTPRYSIWSAQEKIMFKFNRTLYNTQLIQFAHIPAEFVVRFIRYQYRMKVMTFSTANGVMFCEI